MAAESGAVERELGTSGTSGASGGSGVSGASGAASDGLDARLVDAVERLGDAGRAMLRDAAKREGLSVTQAQLLLRVTTPSAGPQSTGSFARWLEVSAPTVSDAAAALVRKGLLEAVPDVTDTRRSSWVPTGPGREAAERLHGWRDPLAAGLSACSPQERAVALRVLLEAVASLNRTGRITVARTCLTCRFLRQEAPDGRAGEWCGLLEAPLAAADLRVDCPEHEPASR
ncbi:MarR family winged helix-turn-helix transcriptional regulator [Kitasatospora sp. NPDC051170]|uniref:MarR family winged helix-turn-helix transcriptional regulator n=1 Tax=Kitasatospora sp. NPDC051170 TaxID=3364056 RepID=UPI003792846F